MTPVATFAQASSDAYAPEGQWHSSWNIAGVFVGLRIIDDPEGSIFLYAFRGTQTAEDFLRDAEAWPRWHEKLGFVHSGFLEGMDDVYGEIEKLTETARRIAFTGHSLGGAHARLMAALFAVNGRQVEELQVFGSPKPAFVNVARVIRKSGMRHVSWRNRNDPVPLVPGVLPYWVHTEPYGSFEIAPPLNDLGPLRDHCMEHYLAGAHDHDGGTVSGA